MKEQKRLMKTFTGAEKHTAVSDGELLPVLPW